MIFTKFINGHEYVNIVNKFSQSLVRKGDIINPVENITPYKKG